MLEYTLVDEPDSIAHDLGRHDYVGVDTEFDNSADGLVLPPRAEVAIPELRRAWIERASIGRA